MLKFENTHVSNIEAAIRGMRNSFDSWEKSDSFTIDQGFVLGPIDLALAQKLVKAGGSHRKFLRQIFVSIDLTAPLYFWKQLDTYKIGTVRNSTSTMHTIMKKSFNNSMFSFSKDIHEDHIKTILYLCNFYREKFLETKDKEYWKALIQILPSAFNQMSTITLNYENLRNIYFDRRYHRLEEWKEFNRWISNLPYAKYLITYEGEKNGESGN